jgi:hypothetical protein
MSLFLIKPFTKWCKFEAFLILSFISFCIFPFLFMQLPRYAKVFFYIIPVQFHCFFCLVSGYFGYTAFKIQRNQSVANDHKKLSLS